MSRATGTKTGDAHRHVPLLVLVAVAVVSASIVALAAHLLADETPLRVVIDCRGDTCTASVNGGAPVRVETGPGTAGDRLGVYIFHSFEAEGHGQYLRNLILRSGSGGSLRRRLLLREHELAEAFEGSAGWRIDPGLGLTHDGRRGDRSVALLGDRESGDFRLEFELHDAVDAGAMVRASDSRNGLVFVVRPEANDAFFFRLVDGTPGPILAIMPLQDLRVGREALRLAGLIANLARCGAILVLCLLVLGGRARCGCVAEPVTFLPRRVVLLAAFAVAAFAAHRFIARYSLLDVPHILDETAYLFQAKIFARGRLWVDAPSLPEFFTHDHLIISDGRWFAKYPPLYPLLLSVGVLLRCSWAVTPLLGALTMVAILLLAEEIAGRRAAIVAGVLVLSSPFFLFMGANMMSHMSAAMCLCFALWFLLRGLRRGGLPQFVLAGAWLGAGLLARPYTAFLVGVPAALWVAASPAGPNCVRGRVRRLAAFAAGIAPMILLYVAWRYAYSGAGQFPSSLYTQYDVSDTLGFGLTKGAGWLRTWGSWGHSPAKAVRSVHRYLSYTADHLFGWPWRASLAFIGVPFLLGCRKSACLLLLATCISLVVGHMFYWATQHIGYGARYWFSAFPAVAVLSAVGVERLVRRPAQGGGTAAVRGMVTPLVITLLVLGNCCFYLPERYVEGWTYGDHSDDIKRAVETLDGRRAVVFVPSDDPRSVDGFSMNEPTLDGDVVIARDCGDDNGRLLAEYATYAGYRWQEGRLVPIENAAGRSGAP